VDALHQRGFARAGLAGQPDDLAFVHGKRDPVERPDRLAVQDVKRELLAQVVNLEDLRHRVPL